MKFYFSGIASQKELNLLNQAGVEHILMDIHQLTTVNPRTTNARIALDSGSYRDFAKGLPVASTWQSRAQDYAHQIKTGQITPTDLTAFDFFVAYDVITNPTLSHTLWERIFYPHTANHAAPPIIPVWHGKAGQSMQQLHQYLDISPIVGLGGLVKYLRGGEGEKDKALKKQLNQTRDETIRWIGNLAAQFPNRFHLFGCSSPNAIHALAGSLYSADSSIWLRGRKYGKILFQHEKHRRFTQAHHKYLPTYKEMTPDELCIASARNIQQFCKEQHA